MAEAVKRMKGSGRIAFLAQQNEIASELKAGWPVKASYLARVDKLGMSYQQFARYVDAFIRNPDQQSRPRAHRATVAAGSAPTQSAPAPLPPKPTPPTTTVMATSKSQPAAQEPIDVRHEPAPQRTFHHHGIVQEGEPEQLFGPGYLPKRRG
jgi:hypothetical protein